MPDNIPFWRRTPPVLFPACLGMFGIALGWHYAWPGGYLTHGLSAITGAAFAVVFICYSAKVLARPGVLIQDLTPHPGKAAVSAGSMGLMLAAALLLAYDAFAIAEILWLFGVALHILYFGLTVRVILKSQGEGRSVTPLWLLPFVGIIVAPLAGIPLGYITLSMVALIVAAVCACFILVKMTTKILSGSTPPPARPAMAILVAPFAIGALNMFSLGWAVPFNILAILTVLICSVLLWQARWLSAAGWTPAWVAFTFPGAASAGVALRWFEGTSFGFIGVVLLVLSSALSIYVAARIFWIWSRGTLAPATGAATA